MRWRWQRINAFFEGRFAARPVGTSLMYGTLFGSVFAIAYVVVFGDAYLAVTLGVFWGGAQGLVTWLSWRRNGPSAHRYRSHQSSEPD